ncbi:hypothetical protein BLA24_06785 [Streptomyces cinnamoneus]|uniref:Uncharacterized protein n=1 Tax=Streptomyces cinnamoneus TaxID=53446 RepID=A0A2G1XMS5_STRCJ|nr:hypothetical protein [Streptomyces cinnamoneus]PHQ52481.1 hypothetical protein BLA24_06785 [Streptomyces cinnamoneus]PPT16014.1 hypothetical protein CYQ11_26935 [Streptomyces cinnamoneus]
MVDPMSLTAISTAVTAAAGAAGTEAGRRMWGSLTDLARRAFGRGGEDDGAAPLPLDPRSEEQVRELAALIFTQGRQDPRFAAEFREWAERASALSVDNSTVTNNFSGRGGVVYQGRDFTIGG